MLLLVKISLHQRMAEVQQTQGIISKRNREISR